MKGKRNTGQTLYRRTPEKWDALAGAGFPSLAAAAKQFYDQSSFADAIGASSTSISRWMRSNDVPRHIYEVQAAEWLRTGKQQAKAQWRNSLPTEMPLFDQQPAQAQAQAHEVVLVVRAPKDVLDGLMGLLGAVRFTVESTA